MNATLTSSETTARFTFNVELDGKSYDVVIFTNRKGKFVDEEIEYKGEELEFEGEEGDIRERITDYIADNWETLVKE